MDVQYSVFTPPAPTSTPNVVRVGTSSRTDRQSEAPLLRAEISSNIVDGIDLRLFVRETLKFPDDLYASIENAINSQTFGPTAEWSACVGAVSNVAPGNEPQLYSPLIRLYNWICGRLGSLDGFRSGAGLRFKDTSQTPLSDSLASRKPDLTGVPGLVDGTPSWKDVLMCWEVKHHKRRAGDQLEEPPRKKSRSTGSRSRSSNSGVPSSNPGDGDDGPRAPLEQLLSYCLEVISAQPHRRHTFGMLLCEWQLQLVFHSRSFIVVSEAFDVRHDRVKLVAAIAALWKADLETLGFDPHFVNANGNVAVRPEGCLVTIKDNAYTIGEMLYRARALFGRITASLDTAGQVRAVIKINSPPKSREVEAELLERAQNIPNVIKVIASAVWGGTLDGFGAEFVELVRRFEVREFRVLVLSPVCVPFTSIQEPEEFQKSFRKLVVAHHELYNIGILHCDISVGNMMYDPVGKEPYLIDVDLGKSVDKLASASSNHRTGTLPFMATDLLVEDPPTHLYRHDLESFYYVLVWMCTPNHCGWDMVYSIAGMREKKNDFFAVGARSSMDRLSLHASFESLRSTWIRNLHILFIRGRRAAVDAYLGDETIDTETLGGHVTYPNFMKVLGESD